MLFDKRLCESTHTGEVKEAEMLLAHRVSEARKAHLYGEPGEHTFFREAGVKFLFDSKTRLSTDQITIPGDAAYTYTLTCNATTGLLDSLQYPMSTSSYQVKLQYTYSNGVLQQISDITTGGPGTTYWTAYRHYIPVGNNTVVYTRLNKSCL